MSSLFAGLGAAAAVASAGVGIANAVGGTNSSQNQVSSGARKGFSKTSGFSPEVMKTLEGLIKGGDFSKQSAINDSNAAVQSAMLDVMRSSFPSIASAGKNAGISGDSQTKIFANDAMGEAIKAGSTVKLNTITNYNNNLIGLLGSLASGQPKRTVEDFTDQTQTQAGGSSGGCFITTAVVAYQGKTDDCQELQVLRWYRDEILMKGTQDQINAVKIYYEAQPILTPILDGLSSEDKERLFTSWYDNYIVPAVSAVLAGDYEAAFSNYTHMFNEAMWLVPEKLELIDNSPVDTFSFPSEPTQPIEPTQPTQLDILTTFVGE